MLAIIPKSLWILIYISAYLITAKHDVCIICLLSSISLPVYVTTTGLNGPNPDKSVWRNEAFLHSHTCRDLYRSAVFIKLAILHLLWHSPHSKYSNSRSPWIAEVRTFQVRGQLFVLDKEACRLVSIFLIFLVEWHYLSIKGASLKHKAKSDSKSVKEMSSWNI